MSDDLIKPDDMSQTLAKAIIALAGAAEKAAGSVSRASTARDFAEAAERLANALHVSASMRPAP